MDLATSRLLAVALAVLLAAGASGCRPATGDTPAGTTGTPAATSAPLAGGIPSGPSGEAPSGGLHPANAPVSVYLVSAEKVAPAARTAAMPAVARGAMLALLAGPTAAERTAGYSTQIPAGTKLLGLTIDGDSATVDLSREFTSGGGTLSMSLRAAQVVHTLTQFSNVRRVRFRLEGRPLELLGGEGIEIAEPQTRAMWEQFAPAVLIESPPAGTEAASPLAVRGTANVFEGVFRLDVVAPDGTILASQRVQAESGTGTRGAFTAVLSFAPWPRGTGTLVAKVSSAKDGTDLTVATVPLAARD